MADGAQFLVLDDFLDEDSWTRLWTEFQFLELNAVTRTTGAWKLDDGVPLGGRELVLPRGTWSQKGAHARTRAPARRTARSSADAAPGSPPLTSPIARLLGRIAEEEEALTSLLDGAWDRLVGRPWVYPRGTGLSWHVDDSQLYAGAFIYYAHPTWNAHWGGELLIGELGSSKAGPSEPLPVMSYRFETESYSERLLEVGGGAFVMPKPNRLVLIAGAPHMVAKVSDAAGHNVRASVAGFFLRPTRPQPSQTQSRAAKARSTKAKR